MNSIASLQGFSIFHVGVYNVDLFKFRTTEITFLGVFIEIFINVGHKVYLKNNLSRTTFHAYEISVEGCS